MSYDRLHISEDRLSHDAAHISRVGYIMVDCGKRALSMVATVTKTILEIHC